MGLKEKMLFINTYIPRYDHTSGDLRLFFILRILSKTYEINYLASQAFENAEEQEKYRSILIGLGIKVAVGELGLVNLLRKDYFKAAFIEFYYNAETTLAKIKMLQSKCPVIIDSVDVHYYRLFLKYQITGNEDDLKTAEKTKNRELRIYKKADLVLTVTDEDAEVLRKDCPKIPCRTVSNIHVLVLGGNYSGGKGIVFVGGFSHEPNIDAVLFFCRDIWPLIKREIRDVTFTIVGSNPPPEIRALSSESICVTGYVPSTTPFLKANSIPVAPLRYGAGMKGKIGEAMAHGLPVVTTAIGAQGMGLISEKKAMIADSPEKFAGAVVKLFQDERFYNQVAEGGWEHIKNNYTDIQVGRQIGKILAETANLPIKKISFSEKAGIVWVYIFKQGQKRLSRWTDYRD